MPNTTSKPMDYKGDNRFRTNYRWMLVAFLFILSLLNYGDRSALGVAAIPMSHALHLTPLTFGIIAGVFSFGYAPFNLIGGILGDRFSPRRILQICATVWGVTIITLSLATGYVFLLINRTIFGAAEGPNFTLDTKLMSRWLPPAERARGLSLITVGNPAGVAFSAPLISLLVLRLGWQAMFVILGALVLIWVIASLFLLHDRPEDSPFTSSAEVQHIKNSRGEQEEKADVVQPWVSWVRILGNGSLQSAAWAYFGFAYMNYMIINWLPSYFAKVAHFSFTQSAFATSIPWLGAIAGSIIAGFVSDQVLIRTGNARLARGGVIGVGLICAAGCLFLTSRVSSPGLTLVFLTLAMFFQFGTNGIYWVVPPSIFPSSSVGRAAGYMQLISSLPGFIAPTVTGVLVAAAGGGASGFSLAFVVASLVVAMGGCVALIGIRPKQIVLSAAQAAAH